MQMRMASRGVGRKGDIAGYIISVCFSGTFVMVESVVVDFVDERVMGLRLVAIWELERRVV